MVLVKSKKRKAALSVPPTICAIESSWIELALLRGSFLLEEPFSIPTQDVFEIHLEAAVAFRIRRESPVSLKLNTPSGGVELLLETEYTESGMPQAICRIKVVAAGPALESTGTEWLKRSASIINCIAVVSNAAARDVQPVYTIDVSVDRKERPFFQRETSIARPRFPNQTRLTDPQLAIAFATCFFEHFDGYDRLMRAIQHYVLSLVYSTPDQRLLCVQHAFIAAEILTPLALRKLERESGLSADEIAALGAKQVGLRFPLRRKRDKQNAAEQYARRNVVFHGDQVIHSKARKISDGFEHGFEDFGKLQAWADTTWKSTLEHIRRAIIECSPLDPVTAATILNDTRFSEPLPIGSSRVLTGTVTDDVGERDRTVPVKIQDLQPTVNYDEASGVYTIEMKTEFASNRDGVGNLQLRIGI